MFRIMWFVFFVGLSWVSIAAKPVDRDPFYLSEGAGPEKALQSTYIQIKHIKAQDIKKMIGTQTGGLLSARGHMIFDDRTNTIFLWDTPENIAEIGHFLQRVDVPTQQIQIEARIVNVDARFSRVIGARFGTVRVSQGVQTAGGLTMDLPTRSTLQPGVFTVAIAKLGESDLLDLELSAMESEGHGRILSRPRLVTTNREPATIETGEEIPYQERTTYGNTSVAFKKAVLSLKVTPEIHPSGKILLHLTVNQDKVGRLAINGIPSISTRELKTQVEVSNGQTLMLGGIFETSKDKRVERIPFLGTLPLLGGLFRRKAVQTTRRELLIFVTPTVF